MGGPAPVGAVDWPAAELCLDLLLLVLLRNRDRLQVSLRFGISFRFMCLAQAPVGEVDWPAAKLCLDPLLLVLLRNRDRLQVSIRFDCLAPSLLCCNQLAGHGEEKGLGMLS
jgi:hypothetical protein